MRIPFYNVQFPFFSFGAKPSSSPVTLSMFLYLSSHLVTILFSSSLKVGSGELVCIECHMSGPEVR